MERRSSRVAFLRAFSQFAPAFAISAALLILAGWIFDVHLLKTLLLGDIPIKANTAVGLILAGVSLWLNHRLAAASEERARPLALGARLCAVVLMILGLLTLAEYAFGWKLGIDEWLFRELTPDGVNPPGRMAAATALAMTLMGISLLGFSSKKRFWLVQPFAIAATLVSFIGFVSSLYGLHNLGGHEGIGSMALSTSITFLLLSLGILASHPERGVAAAFIADTSSGLLARRVMGAAVFIPVLLGWLLLDGAHFGYIRPELLLAVMAVYCAIFLTIFLWLGVAAVDRMDVQLSEVHAKLAVTNSELLHMTQALEDRVSERTAELLQTNKTLEQEIAERTRAQTELLKSEERFQLAVNAATEGIWDWNVATGDMFCSSRLKEILGYTNGEMGETGFFLESLVHPDEQEEVMAALGKHFDSKIPFNVECRLKTRTGESRWCNVRGQVQRNASGAIDRMAGSLTDITEHRSLEEQLRQSQKIEAFGQLAGGVAHDFNNILTILHGNADMMLSTDDLPLSAVGCCQEMLIALERASSLTRQLLAFSRRQALSPEPINLNQVLEAMIKMVRRLIGEDIELTCALDPRAPSIHADAAMIEQVVLNLVINARDAMPKGGSIYLHTELLHIDAAYVAQHPGSHSGEFVCLEARDTGCGMSPQVTSRIFEPFFTTKETGKGTGLGLATVYGIVKQHQGWIEVESQIGEGTQFRVFFPALKKTGHTASAAAEESEARGGTETILLVEDERSLRKVTRLFLERWGYRVLEAASGVEAQEVWETHRDEIDLLFSDMVMPGSLSGRELAEELQSERLNLKVILTSGYSSEFSTMDFALGQGFRFLQKPYAPKKLAAAIRAYLDQH